MKKVVLVLFLLMGMVLSACSSSQETTNSTKTSSSSGSTNSSTDGEKYVLKLAHGFPTAHYMHTFMVWYADEVKKRSNGQLTIDIFPNSQLMPVEQEIPGVIQGQIDISHTSSSVLASFDPVWNFYELPFTFDHDPNNIAVYLDHRAKFNSSENGGRKMAKMMEDKGLKILGIGYIDIFGSLFTTKDENLITNVESTKGLRIRSAGGTATPETIKSLGANSVTISGSEITTALQQGLADGLLTVPMYAYAAKLPVETYTAVQMYSPVTPVVMSVKKFNSLPTNLQNILLETGEDYEKHVRETIEKDIESTLAKWEKEGVKIYHPTEEEVNEMKEVTTKAAWELYKKEVKDGAEFLDVAKSLSAKK